MQNLLVQKDSIDSSPDSPIEHEYGTVVAFESEPLLGSGLKAMLDSSLVLGKLLEPIRENTRLVP